MNKCFFVTGTDTNVGKTVVSCALLQAGTANGYQTVGYKPIASGSKQLTVGLRNEDAEFLIKNSSLKLYYHDVNPIVFAQETSPHIASQLTGKRIDLQIIDQGLDKLKKIADWIIVEGAGGWYTPISSEETMADWVISQAFPVILTVGIKLGCINHAILTEQAIAHSGLLLIGWVANEINAPDQYQHNYLISLKKRLSAPCLGVIPHLPDWHSYALLKFLNIENLL
ncbi:MAG: dethiobiotin synthase [Candidatus Arsenophonus melophagi]|nr:dethiobiotin synthase [Candidatus Arsenophonus melophagi]